MTFQCGIVTVLCRGGTDRGKLHAMQTALPTLDELVAFNAAARHLNFSSAARELGLTPSAVSRQVARIEALLAQPLFVRQGRSLSLTVGGRAFHQRTAAALRDIEASCLELRVSGQGSNVLQLASVPTFSTRWLVPRLPKFLAEHPGITLNFRQHLAPGDVFPQDLDVAIRYGGGQWEGVRSDYIGGHRFVPVASPRYKRAQGLRRVADVARCLRLHHVQSPHAWGQWAQTHHPAALNSQDGPHFEQYSVLIQAVMSDLGLALVPEFLVQNELTSGALLRAFDAPVDLKEGHYLCYRADRLEAKRVSQFRQWLLTQASQPHP
jgi:LysR family transcriptional regulator, glycine cleavage system transcriptional activator